MAKAANGSLVLTVRDHGPGIADIDHVLSGRYPYEAPSIGRLILMHRTESWQSLHFRAQ